MKAFAFLFLVLFQFQVKAQTLTCSTIFTNAMGKSESNYAVIPSTLNSDAMVKKYPRLAKMLKDPDQFFNEMKIRFEKQKAITPENPNSFDFSEMGLPEIKDMKMALDIRVSALEKEISGTFSADDTTSLFNSFIQFGKTTKREQEIALRYVLDLQAEAKQILISNKVSYSQLNEFSYFYTRAMGHFTARNFNWVHKLYLWFDNKLNGYQQLKIEHEYDLYKKRSFVIFQKHALFPKFRANEVPFNNAFFNKDELKFVFFNTNAALEPDIFIWLMNKNIHLVGHSDVEIMADGINRPSGHFRNHDVRHESAKYGKSLLYSMENSLNSRQIEALEILKLKWAKELYGGISKIEDHDVREAALIYAFNFHHDIGFPFVPSVFLEKSSWQTEFMVNFLYFQIKTSGQGVFFKNPVRSIHRAGRWFEKFWKNRLDEERAAIEFNRW